MRFEKPPWYRQLRNCYDDYFTVGRFLNLLRVTVSQCSHSCLFISRSGGTGKRGRHDGRCSRDDGGGGGADPGYDTREVDKMVVL